MKKLVLFLVLLTTQLQAAGTVAVIIAPEPETIVVPNYPPVNEGYVVVPNYHTPEYIENRAPGIYGGYNEHGGYYGGHGGGYGGYSDHHGGTWGGHYGGGHAEGFHGEHHEGGHEGGHGGHGGHRR